MINRFALSFLCIELDRDVMYGVTLVHILLTLQHITRCMQIEEKCLQSFFETVQVVLTTKANRKSNPQSMGCMLKCCSAGSIPDSYDIYRYLNLVRYSIFDTRYFRRKCNFVYIFRGYLKRLRHVHLLFKKKKLL